MRDADRLKSALAALPAVVALRVRAALATVAAAAAADARRRLPAGPLADSIAVRADPDTGAVVVETADPHAVFVEYGTVHQAARPFLRPAVAAGSGEAERLLGAAFGDAVKATLDDRP